MNTFESLLVWKKSHELTLKIYEITKSFPKEEIFGITSQIRRASYSVPSNIVEEAWVIIKPEARNKEKELIKRMKKNNLNNKTENGYVVKEAETVIYDYLKNINNYEDKKKYNDIIKKYHYNECINK